MPFDTISKFGKRKRKPRDVLKEMPGLQSRQDVSDITMSVIKDRRTIRKYSTRSVSDKIITKILDAAIYAPSAGNSQPWEFIVIREQGRDVINQTCSQKWVASSPVIIVVCINSKIAAANYGMRGEKLYGIQSVSAAIQNMLISAESHGLGTAWIGSFDEFGLAAGLKCPDYVRPCAVITVGWPAEKPEIPHRQTLKEFVHLEEFDYEKHSI